MALLERKVKILHPGDPRDLFRLPEIETIKISPSILEFMKKWENQDVIDDYLKRHPDVDKIVLQDLLQFKPEFLQLAGLDFIYAKNTKTRLKEFLMLETNSCPSSFYSMPSYTRPRETLLLSSFFSSQEKWRMSKSEGGLAYLYSASKEDTLTMPHFMAEISQEKVYLVPWSSNENGEIEEFVKFKDGIMYVRDGQTWVPIRACFRWLSKAPWVRIPVKTMKTFIFPHPIVCLSSGKNKNVADLAYKRFNEEYKKFGFEIRLPKTMVGIEKKNMREVVGKEFGFRAIIKTPYDAGGRGIYVIRNESDVDRFLETDKSRYNLFVVQDLIGLETDGSEKDEFIHVGCDDVDGYRYACTFRVKLCTSPTRFKPIVLRGLNAPTPFICNNNDSKIPYVDTMYITNMGNQIHDNRVVSVDEDGMKRMGITDGDIVDVYLQSVMCMIAIDNMCKDLMREDGSLDIELLRKLNPEEQLIREIEIGLNSELFET